MQIIISDPAKVEPVISKITTRNPSVNGDIFNKYVVPSIIEEIENGDTILLDVDFQYDMNLGCITSLIRYTPLSKIITAEEFLNDEDF